MANNEYDVAKLRSITPSTSMRSDARHLIEVRETSGKGLGIFAKSTIPRGTRIIAESPLLKATALSKTEVDVQSAFDDLPPEKQRAYLDLHGYASEILKKDNDWKSLPDLNRRVLAIYSANCWGRDVFWLASRINHSCIPNVHNAYSRTIQKETFHSIRDIEAGEEITISYIAGTHVRDERQAMLYKWGFQCRCLACQDTPDGRKTELRFAQLARLSQQLEATKPGALPSQEDLRSHQKMAALMHSAGLTGKSLGNCYHDATLCSAVLGNVQMAVLWAKKDIEVDAYCVGSDHPDYPRKVGVLKELERAAKSGKAFHFSQINWVLDWDEGPD